MRDDVRAKMLKRVTPRSSSGFSFSFTFFVFLLPSRSQRAYYSRFFFSEDERDVFVGGYSGSSILLLFFLLRRSFSTCLRSSFYSPSTSFAGSKDLVEGVSSRGGKLSSFFFSLPSRRDTFTYISALVTLVGASFSENLHLCVRASH